MTEFLHPAALLPSALQSLHSICATSNTPCYQPKWRGIFHVVSIFFKPAWAMIRIQETSDVVDLG